MQILRPFYQLFKTANMARTRLAVFAVLFTGLYLNGAHDALAEPSAAQGGFGDYATDVTNKLGFLPEIFNYFAYTLGVILAALGLNEMRKMVDGTGGGSLAWRQPLAKVGFAGVLFALPWMTRMAQDTMGNEAGAGNATFGFLQLMGFRFGSANYKAEGLSGMIKSGTDNIGVLVDVASFAGYIIGVFFVVRGIQLLKNHIENPGNSPLPESLKRLAVGGVLLSLPMIVRVVRATFGVEFGRTSGTYGNSGWSTSGGGGSGLDGMMVNFIQDLATPAYFAIEAFCFTAGVVMILFAMQRMVRTAQDGPRGPLSAATISMFFIAGLLISFPQFMGVLSNSLSGEGMALTRVDAPFLSEAGVDAAQKQNALNVLSAVVAFMAVIGMLSIVRGLFMIKTLAEGGQASLMAVTVHLVAGALCVNLGQLVNAVQTSLGLSPSQFGLVFS